MHSPLMNYTSSYGSLKEEVIEWLYSNAPHRWVFGHDGDSHSILFERNEDCVMFVLRWS